MQWSTERRMEVCLPDSYAGMADHDLVLFILISHFIETVDFDILTFLFSHYC